MNALLEKILKAGVAAVPLIALILLSGCHGKTGPLEAATYSPLTGIFTDAPVAGLTYKTGSGAAGTTDAQGRFNYAAGDWVTFSVGGMILGTAAPQLTVAGNAAVTPVGLGVGSTTTGYYVPTVGQLLGTLNSIAVARNIDAGQPSASGMFVMPADTAALMAPILAPFFPPNQTYPTPTTVYVQSISVDSWQKTQLPNLAASGVASVASPAAQAVIAVPSAADATANINQAVNASGVTGTVWTGVSTSGNATGTFYFQPDGNMTGFISGTGVSGLADGDILAGTWSGLPATPPVPPASPAVQFSLISSAGGNYSGTINSGATTATINDSSSLPNPVFSLTQANSSGNTFPLTNPLTNTLYLGGWYGVYIPASTTDVYGAGTPVYLILSPDGTFTGIMDGNQSTTGTIAGTWTPTSGLGSGVFAKVGADTFSFNMATRSGAYSSNGQILGNIVFKRTGILSMNYSLPGSGFDLTPSLTLNVQISWTANTSSTVVSSFPLALNISDSGNNLIASGIQSEINPLGNGAVHYIMADTISVPYPNGISSAYTYSLSSGQSGCTFTNGTGTVVDGQPASAYLTVQITCP
ncbi:MAG: hypothetical protein WBQ69_06875 [Gallionella sp.]